MDFETTQWGTVIQAREGVGRASQESMRRLCEAYWKPLFNYVRNKGYSKEDVAEEPTQLFRALDG